MQQAILRGAADPAPALLPFRRTDRKRHRDFRHAFGKRELILAPCPDRPQTRRSPGQVRPIAHNPQATLAKAQPDPILANDIAHENGRILPDAAIIPNLPSQFSQSLRRDA
jgi:hypothetical protein